MRNLFIIVEGPDNVGKSTLIQNIKNQFEDITFHALHYSNVKQSSADAVVEYSTKMYNEMFKLMVHTVAFDKSGIICDRSHLGEMVYGPIYRGYTGEYVLDIEKQYTNMLSVWDNLILITCYDEPENLIIRDDGLSFSTDFQKKCNEIAGFLNAHEKSNIKNKLLINIKEHDEEEAITAVVKYIQGMKDDQ
jgi:thymidylate kinase